MLRKLTQVSSLSLEIDVKSAEERQVLVKGEYELQTHTQQIKEALISVRTLLQEPGLTP
jgi:hypothetical protein